MPLRTPMPKVLVITGGSRGLGAAIASLAARRGYDVCITYQRERERALAVAETVRAAGRRALIAQGDVGREDDVVRMFAEVDRELGPVSALVNNAGTSGAKGRVDALTAAEIARLF